MKKIQPYISIILLVILSIFSYKLYISNKELLSDKKNKQIYIYDNHKASLVAFENYTDVTDVSFAQALSLSSDFHESTLYYRQLYNYDLHMYMFYMRCEELYTKKLLEFHASNNVPKELLMIISDIGKIYKWILSQDENSMTYTYDEFVKAMKPSLKLLNEVLE